MDRQLIETRRTRLPEQGTEDSRRGLIQRTLIRLGLPPVRDWERRGETIEARVDQGRWIADCPHCTGAEFADPEWPLFVCCSCGSGPHPVTFPGEREAIERALLARPHPDFRNWRQGISVEELERAGPGHRSWTAPRTYVTGEIVTASVLNTDHRDNLKETAPALVTIKGDILAATGANALARVAAAEGKIPFGRAAEAAGIKMEPLILDRDLTQTENVDNGGEYGHYTYAVPAGALGATGGLRLTISGDYLNNTGVDRTLQLSVTFGGGAVLSAGPITLPTSTLRRKWRVIIEMMNSAAAAQKWSADAAISPAGSTAFSMASPTVTTDGRGTGIDASTVDTAVEQTLVFLTTHSAAHEDLSCRKEMAWLEKIPAA